MSYLTEYVLSNYFTTLGIISIIIKIYPYVLLYIKFIFCIVILFNLMTIYNDYYLTFYISWLLFFMNKYSITICKTVVIQLKIFYTALRISFQQWKWTFFITILWIQDQHMALFSELFDLKYPLSLTKTF